MSMKYYCLIPCFFGALVAGQCRDQQGISAQKDSYKIAKPLTQSVDIYHTTIGHTESYKQDKITPPHPPVINDIDYDNEFYSSIYETNKNPSKSKSKQSPTNIQSQHLTEEMHIIFYLPLFYREKVKSLLEKQKFSVDCRLESQGSSFVLSPLAINEKIDLKTQMVQYSFPISAPDITLSPGQFFYLKIYLGKQKRVIVPLSAVDHEDGHYFILKLNQDESIQRIEVQVQELSEHGWIIHEGLSSKDSILLNPTGYQASPQDEPGK